MKTKQMVRWMVAACFAGLFQWTQAQPGGGFDGGFGASRPPFGERPHWQTTEKSDNQEAAKRMTEQMQKALQLTDKQYKKIYKLKLRWFDARTEAMPEREAGGRPAGPGRPAGAGRPDGAPMGERPTLPQGVERPQRPDTAAQQPKLSEASEQEWNKRNKKLQKILTAEQYSRWMQMEREQRGRAHRQRTEERFRRPQIEAPTEQ